MFDPQYLIKKEVEEPETQECDTLSQDFSLSTEDNSSQRPNWGDENFNSVEIHVKKESLCDKNQFHADSEQETPQRETPELFNELIDVKKERDSDSSQTPQPDTPKLVIKAEKQPKRPFKCDQCSYATRFKGSLNKHVLIHSPDKPFKCDLCSYATRYKVSLNCHKILIHFPNKPFKCEKCSFVTRYKGSLKKHESLHSSDKPFKCDECFYSTFAKRSLKKHELTHSCDQPFTDYDNVDVFG